jgi:hypothetical protein
MHGMPPGGSKAAYQATKRIRHGGGGRLWRGWVFVRILSMLIYINHQQKLAVPCVCIIVQMLHKAFTYYLEYWKRDKDVAGRPEQTASAWQRRWEPSKGPESRSRTVYAKLESNSEPERARVCQRVAVRARVGVTESHRKPEKDRERASKSLRESQLEPKGTRVS